MTTHAANTPERARYVKRNRSRYPDHLLKEARGLAALRAAATGTGIDVPEVLAVDEQSLSLPLIRACRCGAGHWETLGRGLAALHSTAHPCFGFGEDNYIGLNPQPNGFDDDWGRFFLERRLRYQIGLIADGTLRSRFSGRLERQAGRLRQFLDDGPAAAALLHGDLWHGNVLCGEDGRTWLIDPAPYYGDSDADIAMTEMFGGFAPGFYAAYRALRPETAAYRLKRPIYNLYHALNHLNLFGSGYLADCEEGLAAIESL